MKPLSVNVVKASNIFEDLKTLGLSRKVYGFMRPDAPITNISNSRIEQAALEAAEKANAAEALNKAYTYGPTALIEPNVEFVPQVEYFHY